MIKVASDLIYGQGRDAKASEKPRPSTSECAVGYGPVSGPLMTSDRTVGFQVGAHLHQSKSKKIKKDVKASKGKRKSGAKAFHASCTTCGDCGHYQGLKKATASLPNSAYNSHGDESRHPYEKGVGSHEYDDGTDTDEEVAVFANHRFPTRRQLASSWRNFHQSQLHHLTSRIAAAPQPNE